MPEEHPLRTFQEVHTGQYGREAENAAEAARRGLNEIQTGAFRRGAEWEAKIAKHELNRYLKGDETPPKPRAARANESLEAQNKRLAEDTFRHYFWLTHGPGLVGAGHADASVVDTRYRALRAALNENVRHASEAQDATRLRSALRIYAATPGMREVLNGQAIAVRQGGAVHVVRATGPLTPNGLPIESFHLGSATPYGHATLPLDRVALGLTANGARYERTLPSGWKPVSTNAKGAIGRTAAAYREMPMSDASGTRHALEEHLLTYIGATKRTAVSSAATRAATIRTFDDAFKAQLPLGTFESRRVFAGMDAASKAKAQYAKKFDIPTKQMALYHDTEGWHISHSTRPGDIL